MLEILGPFYNNNGDIKKGEGSKQFIDLRSFPDLEDIVLTPTLIILKIGNFQQIEDKNYKINLLIPRKTINPMLYNRPLIK